MFVSKDFANRYAFVASLAEDSRTKMRTQRLKHRLMLSAEVQDIDWFDMLLPEDRQPEAFDNKALYKAIHRFRLEDQKRLQRGLFFLNEFDGTNSIIFGSFARAAFSANKLNLILPIKYVIPFNFEQFVEHHVIDNSRLHGVKISPDRNLFYIQSHGCLVYNGESNPVFANVSSDANYTRIFGNNVLVSRRQDLFDIK